jgi:RimJ/RimL family protein N-acetyltransferase
MQKFPTLNTSIKGLILAPLQEKHINFIVSMLNKPTVQKTLFRTKTTVTAEKERSSIEKMYANEKPSVITYILTQKKLLSETYIGYVKIKLIDWSIQSCYVSIAIDDNPQLRGKGFAKATYEAFFPYLYTLGIKKIYGRTYENNIPTIKLNFATGFRLIGRQKYFISYPDNTSLDALLFEKLHPEIDQQIPNKDLALQLKTCDLIDQALAKKTTALPITEIIQQITLPPLRDYLENLQNEFNPTTPEVTMDSDKDDLKVIKFTDAVNFLETYIPEGWKIVKSEDDMQLNFSAKEMHLDGDFKMPRQSLLGLLIATVRYNNSCEAGYPVLGYLLTQEQQFYLSLIMGQVLLGNTDKIPSNFLSCNAITSDNANSLGYLFLGTALRYDWAYLIAPIAILMAMNNSKS